MRTSRRTALVAATAALALPLAALSTTAAPAGATAAPAVVGSAIVSSGGTTLLPPLTTTTRKLLAAPPRLESPTTIRVRNGMGDIKLDPSRDYRIVLPRDRAFVNGKGLSIVGGRNVVVIGGVVDVRDGYIDSEGDRQRRAGYFRKTTGTLHVEGVRFVSSTKGTLLEGITVSLPGARLALQNIWFGARLVGSYAGNHADVLQTWAGPRRLTVDGLTARTTYQGFFLLPQQFSSEPVYLFDLRRVNLVGIDAAYLLWLGGGVANLRTTKVYISGSDKKYSGMWPDRGTWRYVTVGKPPYAYGWGAGLGYVSPGYL